MNPTDPRGRTIPEETGPLVRALAAVAVRPRLWPTALRQMRLLVPRRWWAKPPRVPRPDPDYLHFRLRSMYGDVPGGAEPSALPRDLVAYLGWCRAWRSSRGV